MKHIDIKGYLEAATQSEEAWNSANEKLIEFEEKLKGLNKTKAQIKELLDNTSAASMHLRLLLAELEKYYKCMCGEFEYHRIHWSQESFDGEGKSHAYTNAHKWRSENE